MNACENERERVCACARAREEKQFTRDISDKDIL